MKINHQNQVSSRGFAVLPFLPKAGMCIFLTVFNGWFAYQAIHHWVAGTLEQIQADDWIEFGLGLFVSTFICFGGVFIASMNITEMREHPSGRPLRGILAFQACMGLCIISYITTLSVYVYHWFFLRGATP